jgi:hypothetical protein
VVRNSHDELHDICSIQATSATSPYRRHLQSTEILSAYFRSPSNNLARRSCLPIRKPRSRNIVFFSGRSQRQHCSCTWFMTQGTGGATVRPSTHLDPANIKMHRGTLHNENAIVLPQAMCLTIESPSPEPQTSYRDRTPKHSRKLVEKTMLRPQAVPCVVSSIFTTPPFIILRLSTRCSAMMPSRFYHSVASRSNRSSSLPASSTSFFAFMRM